MKIKYDISDFKMSAGNTVKLVECREYSETCRDWTETNI